MDKTKRRTIHPRSPANVAALLLTSACFTASAPGFASAEDAVCVDPVTRAPMGTTTVGDGFAQVACGQNANASAAAATAVGSNAVASGVGAAAIGQATASGLGALAIGGLAVASGDHSVAEGWGARATGVSSVAIGKAAIASANGANAIGFNSVANGIGAVSVGLNGRVSGDYAVGIGGSAAASGTTSISVGFASNASSVDSIAIGRFSAANVSGGVALGSDSRVSVAAAVAGYDPLTGTWSASASSSWVSGYGAVSVGTSSRTRQITNVAAGTQDFDAANVAQLKAVRTYSDERVDTLGVTIAGALGGGSSYDPTTNTWAGPSYDIGGYSYDNVGDALANIDGRTTVNTTDITNLDNRVTTVEGDITSVTGDVTTILNGTAGIVRQIGGAPGTGTITVGAETGGTLVDLTGTDGERKVTGVAAGDVTASSLDAINGSQLIGVSQSIANQLGGGASVGAGGIVIGPSYAIQGNSYSTVYDAFASVDGNLTTINTNIVNLGDQVNGVAEDALLWNAGKGAFSASHGGAVPNKITDVAAGDLSATSTDAVNGSQLHATNLQVEQNTKAITNLDNRVTTVEGDINAIKTDVSKLDRRVTNVENSVTKLSTTVIDQGEQIAALDKASVKYTLDSAGNATNEVNLTGDGSGAAVTIKNVATGIDDTDAVNVAQLRDAVDELAVSDELAVRYVADENGSATNAVALTGDSSGSPVTVTNVAAGKVDTDAANYGQIKNQVAYNVDQSGTRTNTISLSGYKGQSVVISNLGDGVKDSDAVNVKQLNGVRQDGYNYTDTKVAEVRDYTDTRFNALSGDIRQVRNEARGGIASAMAAAQLRYADKPGVVSVAAGFGGFKRHTSFAGGLGWTSEDLKWRVNGSVGVSLNSGDAAWGVGASYAFD